MSDEFKTSGVNGEVSTESVVSDKSRGLAAVLAFFLGGFGIHRFYVGKYGTGGVMLGLFILGWLISLIPLVGIVFAAIIWSIDGIWALVDFINILIGSFTDDKGRKLK